MKKRILMILMAAGFVFNSQAAWHNMKGHLVLTGLVGLGNSSGTSHYQIMSRGTWYMAKYLGLGGEGSFSNVMGQYKNFDAGSVGGFLHLRLPFGLYAEGGVSSAFPITQGRTMGATNTALFYAFGYAKSLGQHLALEVQYRNSPKGEYAIIQNGFRFGLSIKL